MSDVPGRLLVISAPSGAGKTTLARRLVAQVERCTFSISYTTRAPRGTEQDGVEYHFVDDPTFDRMVAEGAFAEWAPVHGRRYGTARRTVQEALDSGQVVVFDIDVQGGEQLSAHWPEAVTVLVVPPSFGELERRLRGRGTDSDQVVAGRLAAAKAEMERALRTYQYVVVNDALDRAYADLEAIVRAEGLRTGRVDLAGLLERA